MVIFRQFHLILCMTDQKGSNFFFLKRMILERVYKVPNELKKISRSIFFKFHDFSVTHCLAIFWSIVGIVGMSGMSGMSACRHVGHVREEMKNDLQSFSTYLDRVKVTSPIDYDFQSK